MCNKLKVCNKCKKELPLTREYFTKHKPSKDGLHYTCKKCRGFKNYGISLPRENAELIKSGLKRCKYCREIKDINIYRRIGKSRTCEFCPLCEDYHKAQKRIYDKIYYEKNKSMKKDYYSKWKKSGGQELRTMYNQKRRLLEKGIENTLTINEWRVILEYFSYSCAYCGITESEHLKKTKIRLSQEHIVPVAMGGSYTFHNIVPSCSYCNSSKNTKTLEEFYSISDNFTKERYDFIINFIEKIDVNDIKVTHLE